MKAFINGEFQKDYLKTTYTKIPGIHLLKDLHCTVKISGKTFLKKYYFSSNSGKSPEAVFYNEAGEELERLDISGMKRTELRELMDVKGIKKKPVEEEEEEEKPAGHDEI